MAEHIRPLRGRVEWWVPALFAVFSGIWIYGSDALVAAIASSIEQQRVISTYKGFGYVAIATLLLHLGMRAALRRERAEASRVLEARQFNEQIITGAQEGVAVYDRDLRYQLWNPFMEQLTGYPASAVLGKRAPDVFPFLTELGILERLERNLAGETFTESVDFQVTAVGGNEARWASNLSAPLRDLQGEVIGVLAFVRDITVRKQTEAALSEEQERHSRIYQATYDSIYVTDLETGRFLDVNQAFEGIMGYSRVELVGRTSLDLNLWFDPEERRAYYEDMKTHGSLHNRLIRVRRRDGQPIWAECNSSVMELGGRPCMVTISRDVTERKRSDTALRESESLLRTVMENTPDVIMGVDRSGMIRFINQVMPGLTRSMVLGTHVTQWVPEEERGLVSRCLEEAFVQGRSSSYESRGPSPDGVARWFSVRLQPVMVGETAESLIYTVTDITDQRRVEEERRLLEQQLARTQKLESLGSLAGGVAHDMNNVLGAILSLASLHQMREDIDPALRQNMDTIATACLRGRTLVQGLLGFARQGVAEERSLDLNQLVREEVALLERTTLQKIDLVSELAEDLAPMKGDPAALSHALMNLCLNAVDAMPDGGRLILRTHNAPAHQIRLEVSDTGCGMTKEILDKAVDPFFTTKPQGKGTGLGLSIVYGTVKAHRGQMDLRSSPGQGTTVEITLPAAVGPTSEGPVPGKTVKAGPKLQVLLVDDDELIQASTAQLLEAMGHAATVANRGEVAISKLEAGLACEVVILDLNMPGMGGAAALARIRNLRPDLPVLLATGRADERALELVQTVPLVTLMAKPFSMSELQERLRGIGSPVPQSG